MTSSGPRNYLSIARQIVSANVVISDYLKQKSKAFDPKHLNQIHTVRAALAKVDIFTKIAEKFQGSIQEKELVLSLKKTIEIALWGHETSGKNWITVYDAEDYEGLEKEIVIDQVLNIFLEQAKANLNVEIQLFRASPPAGNTPMQRSTTSIQSNLEHAASSDPLKYPESLFIKNLREAYKNVAAFLGIQPKDARALTAELEETYDGIWTQHLEASHISGEEESFPITPREIFLATARELWAIARTRNTQFVGKLTLNELATYIQNRFSDKTSSLYQRYTSILEKGSKDNLLIHKILASFAVDTHQATPRTLEQSSVVLSHASIPNSLPPLTPSKPVVASPPPGGIVEGYIPKPKSTDFSKPPTKHPAQKFTFKP